MKIVLIPVLFSLLTAIFCTPLVVKFFRNRGFGQEIRDDGPLTHMVKRGTPTMGGVAIIGSTIVGYIAAHIVLAFRDHTGVTASGLLLLLIMVGLGLVGFADDFIKIRHQRSLGVRARTKFGGLAETEGEIEQAQKLRYHIFYEEMAAVPSPQMRDERRDFDKFDEVCDHLLVVDRSAIGDDGQPLVVGTYRLMRDIDALRAGGFYTSGEFDMSRMLAGHQNTVLPGATGLVALLLPEGAQLLELVVAELDLGSGDVLLQMRHTRRPRNRQHYW